MRSLNKPTPDTEGRKVTQKDVAVAANVSQALVSLVLGGGAGSEQISPANRKKIIEAAQSLGYKVKKKPAPRPPQKLLAYIYPAVIRTQKLAPWIFDSYEDFYARMQKNVQEAARAKGYTLVAHSDEDLGALTQWLMEWDIQGVLWNSDNAQFADWLQSRFTLVQIDRRHCIHADAAMGDQASMVQIAMEHLYANGHRRIAFRTKYPLDDYLSIQRTWSYRQMIATYGLQAFEVNGDLPLMEWADELGRLIQNDPACAPTALIAPDLQALIIQRHLQSEGLSVPEQLSIVGIDNISACELVLPRLTSVDSQYAVVAEKAIDLIDARLSNPSMAAVKLEISPRLEIRESVFDLTAPAKLDNAS